MPETHYPGLQKQSKTGTGGSLTLKEMKNLNKHAQNLIMNDERKASGIANYAKTNLKKYLQAIPTSGPKDCDYSAVSQQISNIEYIFNQETGDDFTSDDLRKQLIYFMALNCDSVLPELMRLNLLPTSYKDWLFQQLVPETQIDETALLGLRLMLKVTNISQYLKQ